MLMETGTKRDASCFVVGEEINPKEFFIRLKITAVNVEANILEGVIIKVEDFFATSSRALGCPRDGFQVGMELIFEPRHEGTWNPLNKVGPWLALPWFTLVVTEKGEKHFVHYR